jgi:DNA-directed RNA polymerase subunit RPC12/RpoP
MSDRISFDCPGCQARLKAAPQLVGRSGPCPSCGGRVVVPPRAPEEAGPVLVADDGDAHRRSRRWYS